jgi:hypothetical protein
VKISELEWQFQEAYRAWSEWRDGEGSAEEGDRLYAAMLEAEAALDALEFGAVAAA